MRWVDLAGYVASSLVFLTFYMRGMVALRLVALCSNVAFLIYAFTLHLAPIVILHSALIPVNLSRLIAAWRGEAANPDKEHPVTGLPNQGARTGSIR